QIAKDTFIHGRFHRDFNVPNSLADIRYMRWVEDLMEEKNLFALLYNGELAGFYGFDEDKVLLLGIKKEFQGMGLAKPFTSLGCKNNLNKDIHLYIHQFLQQMLHHLIYFTHSDLNLKK